jgi:hypothetical protein
MYNKAKDATMINTNDVFTAARYDFKLTLSQREFLKKIATDFWSVFSAKGGEFITSLGHPPQGS